MGNGRPLIVHSRRDCRHMAGFFETASDIADFAPLDAVPEGGWPVAYMRVAHFLDEELVQSAEVEDRLRRGGTRIVNSADNRILCQRKDNYYARLSALGAAVPFSLASPTIAEVRQCAARGWLRWPFVYRSVDGSGGRDLHLVRDEAELLAAVKAVADAGRRGMAVRFVDSASADGPYFVRRRAFVLFGAVDMWVADVADRWNVQSPERRWTTADYLRENARPAAPELDREMARVAEILGLEVFAADAVRDAETGGWHVVDVNPTYLAMPVPAHLPDEKRRRFEGHFRRVAEALRGLRA